jgi:predicted dehydrogenase
MPGERSKLDAARQTFTIVSMTAAASRAPVHFAAVGLAHGHIDILVQALVRAGGRLAAVVEADDALYARFADGWPQAPRTTLVEVLADPTIELVVTAAVPSDRSTIAAEALASGKDVLADKPLAVDRASFDAVAAAQAESGRLLTVWFGERLYNPSVLRAVELVHEGLIGRVLHFTGFGPHLLGRPERPEWHFDPARNGGILVDLACHQIDLFLVFTGAREASITAARTWNLEHRDLPGFEDVGDLLMETAAGVFGYARVDWHTPTGLGLWGDGRTFLVGSEGTLELRRTIDPAGRGVGGHLFVVGETGVRHIAVPDDEPPFAAQLLADVRDRTETAMSSEHALVVTDLALRAQELALEAAAEYGGSLVA